MYGVLLQVFSRIAPRLNPWPKGRTSNAILINSNAKRGNVDNEDIILWRELRNNVAKCLHALVQVYASNFYN